MEGDGLRKRKNEQVLTWLGLLSVTLGWMRLSTHHPHRMTIDLNLTTLPFHQEPLLLLISDPLAALLKAPLPPDDL